ncbi:MAG: hypothetical protein QGH76_00120 [Phycisphaerales bacterium]|nr:hypothetical protein [Phycisphaerales bacterium]
MTIKTTLATRYWLKTVIMAVVCLGLGAWGAWDYFVSIPQRQAAFLQGEVCRSVKAGLEAPPGGENRRRAVEDVSNAIETAEVDGSGDEILLSKKWIETLELFREGLSGRDRATVAEAMAVATRGVDFLGDVTPPSKFDRPVQIAFILCFPFGIYYFWVLYAMSAKAGRYSLDDDGTLHAPEGSFGKDAVVDIDMGRWSAPTGNARSTWRATVVVDGGAKIVLDDYIFKNMCLIIGNIAHRLYPDQWTPDAKRVESSDSGDN